MLRHTVHCRYMLHTVFFDACAERVAMSTNTASCAGFDGVCREQQQGTGRPREEGGTEVQQQGQYAVYT